MRCVTFTIKSKKKCFFSVFPPGNLLCFSVNFISVSLLFCSFLKKDKKKIHNLNPFTAPFKAPVAPVPVVDWPVTFPEPSQIPDNQ